MISKRFRRLFAGLLSGVMLVTAAGLPADAAVVDKENPNNYDNFAEALQLALCFYDANKCGDEVADDGYYSWRGNCHVKDGMIPLVPMQSLGGGKANEDSGKGDGGASAAEGLYVGTNMSQEFIDANRQYLDPDGDGCVDLTGGWHDAGDHVKFGLPGSYSASTVGWGYYEFRDSYVQMGLQKHVEDELRWINDYFLKATFLDDDGNVVAYCYQVGEGNNDHNYWCAPELQVDDTYVATSSCAVKRPAYFATTETPASDQTAGAAASLAVNYLNFKDTDPEYAQKCLKYANALKDFAAKYPSASYDGIGSFYASGSQNDDVAWADLWCAIANNGGKLPDSYRPISVSQGVYEGNQYDYWIYSWDKVWGGYAALLYSQGRESYGNELVFEMDKLISNKTQYFPIGGWGGSRYNCAWQMYALTYAKYSGSSTYNEYAKSQMDTLLGTNSANRTYLLGCGDTWPQHIHHRAANPNKDTMTYTLYGALVGGPDANGSYDDNTDSYSCTEPALDYNGCFALAAAGLYGVYGGSADKADATIASASEIKSDYVFDYGGGSVIPEPEDTWKIVPDTMTVGETAEAIIQHYIGGNDYIFTSSDPDVLEVSGSGLSATLTAKKTGTVTLTASCGAQILTHEITVVGETTTTTEETTTTTTESTTTTTEEITTTTEEVTTTTEESTTTTTSSSETTTESTTTESATTETTTSTTNGGSVDPTLFYGDVNLDGDIDLADAVLLNKAVAGVVSLNELANKNADCNGNGTVTADDSMMLLQFLVHLINQLGPEA